MTKMLSVPDWIGFNCQKPSEVDTNCEISKVIFLNNATTNATICFSTMARCRSNPRKS